MSSIIVGLITSAIWTILVWFFITRREKQREEAIEEVTLAMLSPYVFRFIEKIVANLTSNRNKNNEFYKNILKCIKLFPQSPQDTYPSISYDEVFVKKNLQYFKAIALPEHLRPLTWKDLGVLAIVMDELDANAWEGIIKASNTLKEDLRSFQMHFYSAPLLKYTKNVTDLIILLEHFTMRIPHTFSLWKDLSSKEHDKLMKAFDPSLYRQSIIIDDVRRLHKILQLVDKLMTTICLELFEKTVPYCSPYQKDLKHQ